MIANDLIKAFLVAWRGESLTGVDSVCNGKARYHCSDSKGKEKTEEGAGRGGRIKRGFLKRYEVNYSIFVSLMEKISRGGKSQ